MVKVQVVVTDANILINRMRQTNSIWTRTGSPCYWFRAAQAAGVSSGSL